MFHHPDRLKRQLWELPTETTSTWKHHCTPFTLPSNGIISFDGSKIQLTTNVVFQPECTGPAVQDVSSIADFRNPFYASTIPQVYVIAATTVIAWILVIMLIITPRTNFLGHSGAAPGFNNGRGIIGGATGGGTSLIGVGSRPWLQKVAAFTVAISLTIATADTFECAQKQYIRGYMDATWLRDQVLGSLEIRITRVVSDVFLWLAQVQTLIRLFPRHREKVLIKWIGFALILFDSVFSCLNSFMINTQHPPRQFVDAIPALSYLFELALGLLYAAWVIYYSMTKRRYAFYHVKMYSITLIAFLSIVAVLTPVVFFVTDVSNQDVAGWGDYFRWVGAAAASVVVWEWVERIEALERDEKKDGILGREIFDGDEMLDVTPNDEIVWTRSRHEKFRYRKDDKGDGGGGGGGNESSALERGLGGVARRFRRGQEKTREHFPLGRAHSTTTTATLDRVQNAHTNNTVAFGNLPKPREQNTDSILGSPTPPPAVASPVSRTDTTSAASTVYVVQYNPTADIPQPVRRRADANSNAVQSLAQMQAQAQRETKDTAIDPEKEETDEQPRPNRKRGQGAWYSVANPFKRKRASPPAEIQQARQSTTENTTRAATPVHNFSRWDVRNRFGVLAAETGEKFRDRSSGRRQDAEVPVTIIPAQPRGSGRAWTPPAPTKQSKAATSDDSGSNESSPNHQGSGSTTLTSNSNPVPTSQPGPDPVSQDGMSPSHAGGSTSPTASRNSNLSPPRADDIRPVSGTNSPTVIPAPRRSIRSSPLATHHASASSSGISEEDSGRENG